MLSKACLNSFLRKNFKLDWQGYHGAAHWGRVHNHARHLAKFYDVNPKILFYFSFLHDVARESENSDLGHGERAVNLISNNGGAIWLGLTSIEYDELCHTMIQHSHKDAAGTITQQVCWDSDRLDLWRVGIMPDPSYLYTARAKALHEDRFWNGYYKYN